MRVITLDLLTRLAIAVLLASPVAACGQKTTTVQVLAINDLHGNLEPPAGRDGLVGNIPAGGAEYLATHLKAAERENPNSILVAAGDLMGASPLLSALFEEQPTIEAVNAMGLAVTSIGNHEMDHGIAELKRRLATAHYQYLAANVLQNGKPIFPATAIRTVGGVKIGFIGETLEDSPSVISAGAIVGDTFLEESHIANEAAAKLEKQGIHAIVLLIHVGGAQHDNADTRDINGCASFSGEIDSLARKLSPAIQVVVSGHTHQFYNCQIAGHTVTSAGAYGRMFTRISLTIDRRTDRVLSVKATNEIVSRDVPKDPLQTAILSKYQPREQAIADQVVGSVTAEIVRRNNPAGESALGDVIADAQLAAVAGPANGGAQIALMNSGGIRADISGPQVTYGSLYAVQPFRNQLTVVTLTGDALRRVLEQQFHPDGGALFLQISAGLTYQYKMLAEPGRHIVPGSLRLNGKPIEPGDRLRVEANDFLIAGSEGLTALKEGTERVAGPADVDALVQYFKTHSPVARGSQDRIVRVD